MKLTSLFFQSDNSGYFSAVRVEGWLAFLWKVEGEQKIVHLPMEKLKALRDQPPELRTHVSE